MKQPALVVTWRGGYRQLVPPVCAGLGAPAAVAVSR
jgi:hypothetical protein